MKLHSARIISVSTPVVDDVPGPKELIAYFARVSSSANQAKHDTGAKLIRSLIKRQEWSPLEMVSVTMEVRTTRAIARQLLRHRSMAFQEFSQRYSDEIEFIEPEAPRMQHPTDRQSSVECEDITIRQGWLREQRDAIADAKYRYETARRYGIAKEVARDILPEGLVVSRLYAAGTLRSWYHYTALRSGNGTQDKHQRIAVSAREALQVYYPEIFEVTE